MGCLSAELQARFHDGYEPRDIDRHDLALLAELQSDDAHEPGVSAGRR